VYSQDRARTSQTDAARARIELQQLGESIANAQRVLEVQLRGLDLEVGILRRSATRPPGGSSSPRPRLTARRADVGRPERGRDGASGDEIARIADLSAFRVEATVPDVHAGRLARGQAAEIVTGETHLRGTIGNIRPTVENGVVSFEVSLDEPDTRSCGTTCGWTSTS